MSFSFILIVEFFIYSLIVYIKCKLHHMYLWQLDVNGVMCSVWLDKSQVTELFLKLNCHMQNHRKYKNIIKHLCKIGKFSISYICIYLYISISYNFLVILLLLLFFKKLI